MIDGRCSGTGGPPRRDDLHDALLSVERPEPIVGSIQMPYRSGSGRGGGRAQRVCPSPKTGSLAAGSTGARPARRLCRVAWTVRGRGAERRLDLQTLARNREAGPGRTRETSREGRTLRRDRAPSSDPRVRPDERQGRPRRSRAGRYRPRRTIAWRVVPASILVASTTLAAVLPRPL